MAAICGIDWAAEMARRAHRRRARRRGCWPSGASRTTRPGIAALIALLIARAVARVAIERPDGLLVERLLAAGHHRAGDPSQPGRGRARSLPRRRRQVRPLRRDRALRAGPHRQPPLPRARARRRRDAWRCARWSAPARTSSPRGSRWPTSCAPSSTLLARRRADLRRRRQPDRARLPGALPQPRRRPRPRRPSAWPAFLARHAYCGRKTPDELLERAAQRARSAAIGELEPDARRAAVLGLVAALRPIVAQISQLTSQIARRRPHPPRRPDLPVSFFRDPKSVICRRRAARRDRRQPRPLPDRRQRSPPTPAKPPSPTNPASAGPPAFRWACDKRLRNHLAVLADTTRHWHPWAHDVYRRASARGHDHPHAIRILGRAWTRVLWRCWQDRVPYDPTQHRALTRHLASRVDTGRLTQGDEGQRTWTGGRSSPTTLTPSPSDTAETIAGARPEQPTQPARNGRVQHPGAAVSLHAVNPGQVASGRGKDSATACYGCHSRPLTVRIRRAVRRRRAVLRRLAPDVHELGCDGLLPRGSSPARGRGPRRRARRLPSVRLPARLRRPLLLGAVPARRPPDRRKPRV